MATPTTTHQTTAPESVPADENGRRNLAGFRVTCSCGFYATNTVQTNVEQDARDHVAWATRKETRR